VLSHLATEALRHQPRVLSEGCLDAELVAGYLDGGLSTKEAAGVEQHLSQCDRCRALAAALVRTAGDMREVSSDRSAPPVLHVPTNVGVVSRAIRTWLPLAAALAVGVVLWMALPRRPVSAPAVTDSRAAFETARMGGTAASSPAPAGAPSRSPSSEQEGPRAAQVPARKPTDQIKAGSRREDDRSTAHKKAAPPPAELSHAQRSADDSRLTARERAEVADAMRAALARRKLQEQRVGYDAPVPASALRAQPAGVVAGSAGARDQEKAQVASATDAFFRARPPVLFFAPGEVVLWRILDRQRIDRSVDRGKTWVRHFEASVPRLFAGSAPAADCAWVAGAQGLVMRWKPDVSWQAVLGKPTDDDLYFVDAKNEHEATVASVSGSTYATTDGGATWKLLP
jgi:hypothetical protein